MLQYSVCIALVLITCILTAFQSAFYIYHIHQYLSLFAVICFEAIFLIGVQPLTSPVLYTVFAPSLSRCSGLTCQNWTGLSVSSSDSWVHCNLRFAPVCISFLPQRHGSTLITGWHPLPYTTSVILWGLQPWWWYRFAYPCLSKKFLLFFFSQLNYFFMWSLHCKPITHPPPLLRQH